MNENHKYQCLLMDLDMTILDFNTSERLSVDQVLLSYGVEPTRELEERYHVINQRLWSEFEKGRIRKGDIMERRFARLFRELSMEVDGEEANGVYRKYLRESAVLMPDAKEICQYLSSHYSLYIVTNGWADTQYRRIELSGLGSCFKGVFVSEESGSQKPCKEFFDYCFARIGAAPEGMLMIGDSLGSDISGGCRAGIDTCWINPGKLPRPSHLKITYEVEGLRDLKHFL